MNSEYAYDLSVALCASSAAASYREFKRASEVIFGITVPRYRKVMLFVEYRAPPVLGAVGNPTPCDEPTAEVEW